ncbi:MAG: tetratricopeptide repeat protein [Candidatus Sabulitectum sp.]|nr:tetratricopeptide repeat protein [Candidatus Sabulitectum sp.]
MTENVTSLKKKAHDLVQKGRLDSALKIFNLVVEEDPEDASVHNKVGDILLKLKQDDNAREHFLTSAKLYSDEGLQMVSLSICRKIIRAFPTEIEANLIMGNCFLQQNKNEQAKKEYITYLKGKPSLDSPDVAIALKALTVLEPDAAKWVSNLAKVAYKQENEAFLDHAVSISMERNLSDLDKIAHLLKKLRTKLHPPPKKKPAHKAKNQKSTEPDLDSSALLTNLSFDQDDLLQGDSESSKGLQTETLTDFREGPSADSEIKKSTQHRIHQKAERYPDGRTEKKNLSFDKSDILQGRNESSEDILSDITSGDGEDWSIAELENTGPQRIGEYFVACGLLKAGDVLRALEQQSTEPEDARLGDVLVSMNLVSVRQVREALSKQVAGMRNRLDRNPGDALGYIEMANLLLDVGDFYGAVGAYLRAAEIYRNDERDYMVFELLEGILDICPESLSAAKEIVRIRHTIDKEGQSRAFYRLAVAYLLNDSQYEAIASLEAAVEVCPDYKDAQELMNGLRPEEHRESGVTGVADILDDIDNLKIDTSKKALADIIMEFKSGVDSSISKEDYATHFDLGIAYREMGLFREAIQEFERVLISPDQRIKAREMLGRCTFDMKRYDEAEDHFRKGLVLATTQGNRSAIVGFHVNLCRVYDFTGRSGHAEAEKKLALELDPVMAKALQLE